MNAMEKNMRYDKEHIESFMRSVSIAGSQNHLLFRRVLLETYLSAVQEYHAMVALRLDRSADDFLAKVAEFTLDIYLND